MGISIRKRKLTLPHMEMETDRFHVGITYWDPHMETENDISHMEIGSPCFHMGIK
jgi:hypothetical protein